MGSTKRNFRCDDELWARAVARAAKEDTTVTDLITDALVSSLDGYDDVDPRPLIIPPPAPERPGPDPEDLRMPVVASPPIPDPPHPSQTVRGGDFTPTRHQKWDPPSITERPFGK